jgi:hypothetical protein
VGMCWMSKMNKPWVYLFLLDNLTDPLGFSHISRALLFFFAINRAKIEILFLKNAYKGEFQKHKFALHERISKSKGVPFSGKDFAIYFFNFGTVHYEEEYCNEVFSLLASLLLLFYLLVPFRFLLLPVPS